MSNTDDRRQTTDDRQGKILKSFGLFTVYCLLFTVYSFLPLSQLLDSGTRGVHFKFDTPDEVINYAFAHNFQKTDRLYYVEYLNDSLAHPIVFPRWARPDGAFTYPGMFLGMIILTGSIAKALGTHAIPFITPFIAVLLVLISYSLVKRFFDKNVALMSFFILALFPVFLYYASRTMFHTILFLFFVLLGVWLYLKAFEDSQNELRIENRELRKQNGVLHSIIVAIHDSRFTILYYLSALSFGLALFIRFADVWWVLLTMIVLMLYKRMDLKRNILFWLIFLLTLIPTFYLNNVLYGTWLDFGYSAIAQGSGSGSLGLLGYLLPFGFHPRVMWNVTVNVLIQPYWWFFALGLTGYAFVMKEHWRTHKREVILFSCYVICVTCYVIALYGSWKFSDSVDPNVIAISSSYYRYFLPLFILCIPFVGYGVSKIIKYVIARSDSDVAIFKSSDFGQRKIASQKLAMTIKYVFVISVILWFCVFSFSYAYLGEEGLLHVRRQVLWYRQQVKILQERGASYNDLFLVRRGQDKMLFPEFPKVVNVDYIEPKLVEESLKKYKGIVWESRNGAFQKRPIPLLKK